MRPLFSLLVLIFPATAAIAQLPYTAHPIDALHGSLGHWTPLGALSTGNSDESRSQHLLLAPYLPGVVSRVFAIEVAAHQAGTVPYERLDIFMGHTTATELGKDFATNLPAPITVYSATNFSINWSSTTQWQSIQLQTPFFYDGKSNLIIEIQKVVDRPGHPGVPHVLHQMSNLPQRRDLPRPLFKDGIYQSGASNAVAGTIYVGPPMLMRLTWIAPPTLTIDCSRASGANYFRPGSDVGLHTHAPQGSVFVAYIDNALAPQRLSVPPILGGYWLPPRRIIVLGAGLIASNGVGELSVKIPDHPELANAQLFFQSLVLGTGMNWTNVVDAIVSE